MATSLNGNHATCNVIATTTQDPPTPTRERPPDNYESFLSVYSPDHDRTKHRRTASMRSDIGSRRQQSHRTPVRTGSASEINKLNTPLPSSNADDPSRLHRVRSFTKTSKGLVNRGDSIRRRHNTKGDNAERRSEVDSRQLPVAVSIVAPSNFKVAVMGSSKVGKSSLVTQFMTSEYMGAAGDSPEGEQSVSVVVDGAESNVDFVDEPSNQNIPRDTTPDGYLVVYSLTDKRSFRSAYDVISSLRQQHHDTAIVLVANKNDLVRKRKVTEQDGKRAAHAYNCTYIETSAAICHNVDELLVMIVGDIRKQAAGNARSDRKPQNGSKGSKKGAKRSLSQSASGILRRVFSSIRRTNKSSPDL